MVKSEIAVAMVFFGLAPLGCGTSVTPAAKAPTPNEAVCTGTIGMALDTQGVTAGKQRLQLAVFRAQDRQFSQPADLGITVRVRLFRLALEANIASAPGQELRLMLPEVIARPTAGGAPVGPLMPAVRYNYSVEANLDRPGTWGAELFATAPWQTAPAFTTVLFAVAPSHESVRQSEPVP